MKAQVDASSGVPVLLSQNIDESKLFVLRGNTRSEANAANDRGRVADNLPLEHILLQLRRSPEQQAAFEHFLAEQQNPRSPNYHHWLTNEELSTRFGLAKHDVDIIANWLESHGFTVNGVYSGSLVIDFSGTAGAVREAFHTEIHHLLVNGNEHIANMSDPQIPAALAPAIVGVVSLHDFRPHPMNKPRPNYSAGSGDYLVVPADLATIYNFNPVFTSGITGTGQTIVVIEDTNVYSTSDWSTFRSVLGLSKYKSGSFTQVHPGSCTNPGVVAGNDAEAILDAEWASAAAPSAAIQLASCADTSTTFGGLIALQNLLNQSNIPAIISISYGECEAENGASANAAYSSVYSSLSGKGVSVFVSSGDEGAASCDADESVATHGIGVSGFASTPYNVAVGGTDFGDTYAGTNSTYWNSSNTSTYESAKSYIPEIPWNDSCASVLLANYEGYATTYGSNGFCNSYYGEYYFETTASGSGGPSGCATGAPSTPGVVSGTCKGYQPQPSWQAEVVGMPSNGVRNIPDVSLFAANGLWGHYYVFCWSDTRNGGASCSGAPVNWSGAGGTSFSSPIVAGVQALINQKKGAAQGNPNFRYYALAAGEYGSTGNSSCNSTSGKNASSTCIFYDVTQGDMDVNCTGSHNCYTDGARNGVLSTSNSSYSKAYGTTTGWDFATGIGTINVNNLVNNF